MIVSDASVLIALAKTQRLQLLQEVYREVGIGPVVKAEVVDRGKAISAPGVEQIEKAMADGWIEVLRLSVKERQLKQRLLKTTRLDEGEAESLAVKGGEKPNQRGGLKLDHLVLLR